MDIQLKVNDRTANAYLALPASGKGPGILLLHAWWGLKPYFRTLCDRLAAEGYTVLAPDLNNGKIATTIDEAKDLLQLQDQQFMGDTLMAAKDYLLAHPACSSQKLGVIGFSMGAAWALVLATFAPEKVAATVMFYGNGEGDLSRIKSKVLGHFSDVDEWEDIDYVRITEKGLRDAGVNVTFHIYPGLAHWFMEEDRPEYDPEAAKLAWKRTLGFLSGLN